jgi:uncharacterized protein YwlG (UPF0340 family)
MARLTHLELYGEPCDSSTLHCVFDQLQTSAVVTLGEEVGEEVGEDVGEDVDEEVVESFRLELNRYAQKRGIKVVVVDSNDED